MYHRLCIFFLLLLAACQSSPETIKQGWIPPAAGTVIANDSMKINDKLNDFYFALKLTVSDENKETAIDYGFVYDVVTHYGPNNAESKIMMPRGGKRLQPLVRKDPANDNTFIIGFIPDKNMGGDGKTFKEYYAVKALVVGNITSIKLEKLKDYRFE